MLPSPPVARTDPSQSRAELLRVGQCFVAFLPRMQVYLYHQLLAIDYSTAPVITLRRINEELFPYSPLYCFSASEEPSEKAVERARDQLHVWVSDLVEREELQLLHCHGGHSGIMFLPCVVTINRPLITSFMGRDVSAATRDQNFRRTLKLLFRLGSGFTVLSEHMRQQVIELGCPTQKVHVVRRGIPLELFPFRLRLPPRGSDPIIVVSICRFVEKKGLEYLLPAFREVARRRPRAVLWLIGEGPLRPRLEQAIRELGLTRRVELLGWQPYHELSRYLHSAHIFCQASATASDGDQEGIPNALKEAMATGIPCVATAHAGIPELVHDGITGLLASEANPSALAEQLMELIDHPELWPRLGHAAREIVQEKYDLRRQVQELQVLYREVLYRGTAASRCRNTDSK